MELRCSIASVPLGPELIAVHGNVDGPEVRARLPERVTFSRDGSEIGIVHDSGRSGGRISRLRDTFPGAAAVIFGHSHLPLLEGADEFQIFNPGSPTERRRAPEHTMGLLETAPGRPPRFELVRL